MFRISASGPRDAIMAIGDALSGMDPSPCTAVDTREESRAAWRLDAYAETEFDAVGAVGIAELVAPELPARYEAVETRDWVSLSLEGLPPVAAGRFIVAGAHALSDDAPGKTAILIEAGPAFGTGHHGTTLGCLLGLEQVLKRRRPKRVLDLGTGSGVLGIASVKSGAARALGTDLDGESVRIARENAVKNRTGFAFRGYHARGANAAPVQAAAPYDLVFANILLRPLVRLAPDILRLTAPGGSIILSGLLLHQEPLARAAFTARGAALSKRIRRDGWLTLVLTKPSPAKSQPRLARRAQRALRRARRRVD